MRNNYPAIHADGLRIDRGHATVLPRIDVVIERARLVGLLGPSGSGKTTLMRSVVGVQHITGGALDVLGLPAGDARLRSRVGYVTQSPSVYADLSVVENLRYFATVLGVGPDAIERALGDVDLTRMADRIVSTLSGGERSRVSLAVALLGDPELLVLDEPTVGLDPVLRRDLWALFARLRDRGVTLLVSSHVMDEATRCDRLLFMRDGQVIADGSLPELLARTGAADAEGAFLAAVEERHDDQSGQDDGGES